MIALWMAYTTLVASALAGAALGGETAFRRHRKQVRLVWAASLMGSLAVPLGALVRRGVPASDVLTAELSATSPGLVEAAGRLGGVRLPPIFPTSLPAWLEEVAPLLLGAWVAASLVVLTLFGLGLLRMASLRGSWPPARVGGERVRVSRSFGPALVGIVRPEIVLPSWALGLDPERLALVLRHEREHREGRDTLLLTWGVLAVAAAPWNPLLWWQFSRLRMAVEMDCDLRVLAKGASRRRYGETLLLVGERMGRPAPWAPALSEPASFLERRMKMITRGPSPARRWRTCGAALLGGALLALACEVPAPTSVDGPAAAARAPRPVPDRGTEGSEPSASSRQMPPGSAADLLDARDASEARGRGVRAPLISERIAGGDGVPMVFIEGRRVTFEELDHLSPDGIERIEVLKGPAALGRFGEEGRHGVVTIFLKAGPSPTPRPSGGG